MQLHRVVSCGLPRKSAFGAQQDFRLQKILALQLGFHLGRHTAGKCLEIRLQHDGGVDQRAAPQAIRHQRKDIGADSEVEQALCITHTFWFLRHGGADMAGQLCHLGRELSRQVLFAAFQYAELHWTFRRTPLRGDGATGQRGGRHGAAITTAHNDHIKHMGIVLFLSRNQM